MPALYFFRRDNDNDGNNGQKGHRPLMMTIIIVINKSQL